MTMGIQALVVLGGIVAALVVGVVVGLGSNSPSTMGWTVLVFGAATYAALSLIERALGRGIWEYTAPYPYDSAGTIALTRLPGRTGLASFDARMTPPADRGDQPSVSGGRGTWLNARHLP